MDTAAPPLLTALESALRARHLRPEDRFDRIADAAIRRSTLVVAAAGRESRFDILEVEMYLYCWGHADVFVHQSHEQMAMGEWYFHREGAAKIGFTLKGVDITFGSGSSEYGGMLIRAVTPTGVLTPIDGPSRTVDAILRAAGVTSVLGLKALPGFALNAFSLNGVVRVENRAVPIPREISTGPRIGLGKKLGNGFRDLPYRYRACPELAKKERHALLQGRRLPDASAFPAPPMRPSPDSADAADGTARAIIELTDDDIDAILNAWPCPAEPSE